jgi:enterochelin esterase-like enzyme
MARKRPQNAGGSVVVLEHTSKILADNPLGDPSARRLAVWLPDEYDSGATHGRGRRFPVLYDLVGFTGTGIAHLNWKPFSENVAERAARLIRDRKMGPAIIAFPDCFTSLGGNQYVNSPAIGMYADFLLQEVIPLVDREFRTLASREHRGCFGKSSGGYGAMIHGMKYTAHWGAIANTRSTGRTGPTPSTNWASIVARRARLAAMRTGSTRRTNARCPTASTTGASAVFSKPCGRSRSSTRPRATRS